MNQYLNDTDFLFASPSFIQGIASAIDIGGTLVEYNASKTVQEADAKAIASDWAVTGKDIKTAIDTVANENDKQE